MLAALTMGAVDLKSAGFSRITVTHLHPTFYSCT